MPNFLMKWIKALLILSVFLLIVANFDSPAIGDSYPLESVSTKENGQTSRIYRAEGKTVPEVAKELSELRQPDEISKEDAEHMFLIYSDELYHLQRDQAKPSDTLIEVDSKEYVRENYDSSFLQGYILASVLDDLFDGHKKSSTGSYRGYSSKDIYKPSGSYHVPSEAEKKAAPPITKEGTGSITKRSDSKKNSSTKVGQDGNLFKKQDTSSGGSKGKIIRSSDSSSSVSPKKSSVFSNPKSKSPPRTKAGSSGRITKRR